MSATIIKREVKMDAVGIYVAFTFADGHVETDPPGRPLSKEDVQRQIRDSLALSRAKAMLSSERTRYTKSAAQQAAPTAQQIARAEFDVVAGGIINQAFNTSQKQLSTLAVTATANADAVTPLVSSVPLGGPVEGTQDTVAPPAIDDAALRRRGYVVLPAPSELMHEVSDA